MQKHTNCLHFNNKTFLSGNRKLHLSIGVSQFAYLCTMTFFRINSASSVFTLKFDSIVTAFLM